jgi:hypothetical protein
MAIIVIKDSPISIYFNAMLPEKWIQILFRMSANSVVVSLEERRLGISFLITYLKPFFHFFEAVIT